MFCDIFTKLLNLFFFNFSLFSVSLIYHSETLSFTNICTVGSYIFELISANFYLKKKQKKKKTDGKCGVYLFSLDFHVLHYCIAYDSSHRAFTDLANEFCLPHVKTLKIDTC